MPAYCDVDGVPVPRVDRAADRTILRDEWGFDGIVASDYIGVEMLATAHRLTGDLGEAARLALVAGVDASCRGPSPSALRWTTQLADGRVPRTPTSTRPSPACSG